MGKDDGMIEKGLVLLFHRGVVADVIFPGEVDELVFDDLLLVVAVAYLFTDGIRVVLHFVEEVVGGEPLLFIRKRGVGFDVVGRVRLRQVVELALGHGKGFGCVRLRFVGRLCFQEGGGWLHDDVGARFFMVVAPALPRHHVVVPLSAGIGFIEGPCPADIGDHAGPHAVDVMEYAGVHDQIFSGRDFAFVVGHFVGGDSHRAPGDDLGGRGRLYDVVFDDSVVAVFMPARRASARSNDLVVLVLVPVVFSVEDVIARDGGRIRGADDAVEDFILSGFVSYRCAVELHLVNVFFSDDDAGFHFIVDIDVVDVFYVEPHVLPCLDDGAVIFELICFQADVICAHDQSVIRIIHGIGFNGDIFARGNDGGRFASGVIQGIRFYLDVLAVDAAGVFQRFARVDGDVLGGLEFAFQSDVAARGQDEIAVIRVGLALHIDAEAFGSSDHVNGVRVHAAHGADVKGDAGVLVVNDVKDVSVGVKFVFAADQFELLGSDLRVDLNRLGIEVQAVGFGGVEAPAFNADLALIYHKSGQPAGSVDLRIPGGEDGSAGVDIAKIIPDDAVGIGDDDIGLFAGDFDKAVEIRDVSSGDFVENDVGAGPPDVRIAGDISG